MSEDQLTIESIDIERAPGFESGGFELSACSPGVTIVHGPNGSGKTTTARSIQALLWPNTADDRHNVVGQFSIGEDSWRVDLVGDHATYQQNGSEANGPNLPSPEARSRYHFPLHDLLQEETRNESFARRIQRESRGGYDLDAASDELGFDDEPSTRGISEFKAVNNTQEQLQEARHELQKLDRDQNRLPPLKRQLEEAEAARSRVGLLEQAIDFRNALSELEEAEATLESYPDILAEIEGDEAERVRDITGRIDDLRAEIETAESAKADAEETLEAIDLPEGGVTEGTIGELKDRRDSLDALESDLQTQQEALADAKQRRSGAHEDLPIDVEKSTLESLDPAVWSEVEDFARRAQRVQANQEARAAVESWLSADEPEQDPASLDRGKQALEGWLAAGGPQADPGSATIRIAAVSAALVAAAGILLGALVHPGLFATVALAAGILWYGYRHAGRAGSGHDPREPHRDTFEGTDLEPPAEWGPQAVRQRLNEIYDDLAAHRLANQREERRAALTDEIEDLEQAKAELEERRNELLDRYGVAPDTDDIELVVLTKGIVRWQELDAEVRGTAARIDELEEEIAACKATLEESLGPYGYGSVDDSESATGYIRDLEERNSRHTKATRKLTDAEDTIAENGDLIEDLETERREIYEGVGLDVGDLSRLEELCDQVDEYEDAEIEVERKREVVEKEEAELEAHPKFDHALTDTSVAELEERKREAEATAETAEGLQKKITEIETRIEEAKQSTEFEEALTEKERALDALHDRLQNDAEAMVGDVLVEHLREGPGQSTRPEVFDRADEVLVEVTRGRYELRMDGDSFRAYDTVTDRGHALDELSSGTRVQLLLAVRIAFVEQQEQGLKLPLVFDEALANSDDARTDVIVESVIELARTGRQVFYFTAQGDEVAKWEHVLGEFDDVDATTVDLGSIRESPDAIDVPAVDELHWDRPSPPEPEGHDHESYGEAIDVPPFSPRRGAGATHVWYLVEEVDLLHRLLQLGVETWGQLETMLERSEPLLETLAEEEIDRIQENGAALEEFVRAWEVGRGKRVDRTVLEDTDAVTGSFIDEVSELAEAVDGDAEQIIEGLRDGAVNRFRSGKMDDLEQYFEEHGYIQHREPVGTGTIRSRMVNRLVTEGRSEDEAFEQVHDFVRRLLARSE